jgi:hypothetical protein
VQVTIHAEFDKGFEKSKLQDGVMEPLWEAVRSNSRRVIGGASIDASAPP